MHSAALIPSVLLWGEGGGVGGVLSGQQQLLLQIYQWFLDDEPARAIYQGCNKVLDEIR